MKRAGLAGVVIALVAATTLATAAHAALHSRLGGAAAYDDVLNITWLSDAGLSGNDSWDNQRAWVAGLNSAKHLGFDDWRLASMSVASGLPTGATTSVFDCSTVWEPLCRDNELSYMFYHNLGGASGRDLTGSQTVGDVTLTDIQPVYWSGTEYADGSAWILHFSSGFGVWSFKDGNRHAWVVRAGDVGEQEIEDSDGDGVEDTIDNCPSVPNDQTDTDADSHGDSCDNCSLLPNADQRDTNGDGFGNQCDPDLNDDCSVNFADLGLFKAAFTPNPYDADADFDGDGFVNFVDLGRMNELFFTSSTPGPGASGLPTDCD